jgi:hypothetical protein
MLGSITPLGERSRGSRWWLTTTAYVVGSASAGLMTGALLGAAGSLVIRSVGTGVRLGVLGLAVAIGLAFDLGIAGLRLPTVHRQVAEAWRTEFRGWAWGLGFGLQLGPGVVTIVTTSTIYATWLAAFLSGSAATGAVVGLAFGLARSLPILAVSRVRRPDQLLHVDGVLTGLAAPARRLAIGAGAALAALSLAGAARW